jgi:hypothetical protein
MTPKRRVETRDIVLTLLGILVAFGVQVVYDIFGSPPWTTLMPKANWGVLVMAVFFLGLFGYAYWSPRDKTEKEKS